MQQADKGHGVLLLTLNYAGDQLAGKQAMKLAQKAGMQVRQVVTGEEIRYDPEAKTTGAGLAGAVPLYHIAAAAAAEGKSLDEVADLAQRYADSMASITVKSTDATHPQNGMSFGDLGETDQMEIGAGQAPPPMARAAACACPWPRPPKRWRWWPPSWSRRWVFPKATRPSS